MKVLNSSIKRPRKENKKTKTSVKPFAVELYQIKQKRDIFVLLYLIGNRDKNHS